MILDEIIIHLRQTCPGFKHRVSGALTWGKTLSQLPKDQLPACWVVPAQERATTGQGNAKKQMVEHTFVIVVVAESKRPQDGVGLGGSRGLAVLRQQLFNSLIGWIPTLYSKGPANEFNQDDFGDMDVMPNSNAAPFQYLEGGMIDVTEGEQVIYQYTFQTSYYEGADCVRGRSLMGSVEKVHGGALALPVPEMMATNGAEIAKITITDSGRRVWEDEYTFDTENLILTFPDIADGTELHVEWSVEDPQLASNLAELYAQYHPTLLALAGGDPSAITPEMYQQLNIPDMEL